MVSVIVPIYKAEKSLPRCIDSILAQTYTDFELLLIDDGSPDNCGIICDEYAERDNRIRVFHQENGGVSRARNCGMDNMQGEYFVCIDSDDIIEPCYLEDLVTTQENHPEFGHVLCGLYCVSQKKSYVLTEKEALSVVDRKDYMRLLNRVLIQGPCLALYRAEIVKKNNIRMREDLSLAEDLLFNLEYLDALEITTIGVINKPNYIYQDENQDSLFHRFRQDFHQIIKMVNIAMKQYMQKWDVTDERLWVAYYNKVFDDYINVMKKMMSPLNPMTKREKVAYNNSVLQEKEFIEALNNTEANIDPKLKEAYLTGDYKRVLALKRLIRIKSKLYGVMKA